MAEQEVERIRDLLEELEARQHARNRTSGPLPNSSYRLLLRKKPAVSPDWGARRTLCELYAICDVACAKQWADYDRAKANLSGGTAREAPQGPCEPDEPKAERPEPVCSREIPPSAEKTLKAGRCDFHDADDFDAYLSDALEQAAFDRVCVKLGARERASCDVISLLEQEGYGKEEARRAVARAQRCGVVDDKRYAQAYVRAKVRAGWGKARIERGLGHAHLSLKDCDMAAGAELDAEQEFARALAAARKKRVPDKNPTEKLARFLAGRGYSMAISLRAAKQAVAESQEHFED